MKYLLLIVATVLTTIVNAQSGKIIGAWKNLNDYRESKDFTSLDKAKQAIDTASKNNSTKDDAKTWLYRGDIYKAVFEYNFKMEYDKADNKDAVAKNESPEAAESRRNTTAYQNTKIDDLKEASDSYLKSLELDKKKTYFDKSTQGLTECSIFFENRGVSMYKAKKYSEALLAFEGAINVNTSLGQMDTININNAALVASKDKNFDKAKTYYQKLVDLKYGGPSIYEALSSVYQNKGDTMGAFEIVKKGRLVYPNDANLLIAETSFYLNYNKTEEAISNLKLAIKKRPDDASLYLVLGNLYDNLANPKDVNGKEVEKPKNYEESFLNAEEHYKKAIEVQPDYFDALFNLGVLYNNHGVSIAKRSETIKDNAKYAAENAKATEEFKKALPFLEKARTINSTDVNLLFALKQLYARTNQPEKLKEVNDLLKN